MRGGTQDGRDGVNLKEREGGWGDGAGRRWDGAVLGWGGGHQWARESLLRLSSRDAWIGIFVLNF
jgi:hypothetical protein